MNPLRVLHGNNLETLATLAERSVHCCITSPPYWGLRDYMIEPSPWPAVTFSPMPGLPEMTCPAMECVHGLEPDVLSFVAHEVAIFRAVRRVLRDDGTLWLNLGDRYCTAGGNSESRGAPRANLSNSRGDQPAVLRKKLAPNPEPAVAQPGLKPKDLFGLPWRVAFALQADGWYLRNDCLWNKPNPSPESADDRCTRCHEYIFLFSKSETYFFDAVAIEEPVSGNAHPRGNGVNPKAETPTTWNTAGQGRAHDELIGRYAKETAITPARPRQNASHAAAVVGLVSARNKRTVWTFPTQAYRGAHFATFPEKLPRTCLLAGTSQTGVCSACGAPYERVIETEPDLEHQQACGGDMLGEYHGSATKDYAAARAQDPSAMKARILAGMVKKRTVGWKPTCLCSTQQAGVTVVPATVLDCFGGSGTTAKVALENGRHAILCEINSHYLGLIAERTHTTLGLPLA